jgi:hypothetical protein
VLGPAAEHHELSLIPVRNTLVGSIIFPLRGRPQGGLTLGIFAARRFRREARVLRAQIGQPLTPRDLEVFSKVLAALRGDYGEEARRFVRDFIVTWNKGVEAEAQGP